MDGQNSCNSEKVERLGLKIVVLVCLHFSPDKRRVSYGPQNHPSVNLLGLPGRLQMTA